MGASGVATGRSPERSSGARAPARTLIAVLVGVALTLGILLTPYLAFGVESPRGHLVLNTLDAGVGLLAAFLVYGRFLRNGGLQDLLLVQGLALLVVAGLGITNVTQLASGSPQGTMDVWLALNVRVTGAVLIAAAALVGPRREVTRRWSHLWQGLTVALAVSVIPVLVWEWVAALPVALDLAVTPDSAQHPIFTGHPLLLVGQGFSAVCFAVAAALFSRQAADCENELLLWLGPACALGAFARLNYVLFPSLYTDWLYTGDLLRTGFYILLLVGAAREIRRYWTDRADLAVLEDRRRLARELHDGVIQELSFIKAQSGRLGGDANVQQQIMGACERGLEEARAAVVALGAQGDEPVSAVLASATRQLGEQYGVEVQLQLDEGLMVEAEERHALVRIAREAVTNAVKHGDARTVQVTLGRSPDGRHLVVHDDGSGFDVAEPTPKGGFSGGYGLISMRDRARGLQGRLEIESSPGAGSTVRVTW